MIVTGQDVVEWVRRKTNPRAHFGDAVGIGFVEGGRMVGAVAYNEFNGVNMQMHVASDGTRRWMKREYLRVAFDYPFNQAGVKRITGLVAENNLAARRFDEHLGFELEARLKDADPGGDMLVYVMWKDKCKWIREDFVRRCAAVA